MPGPGGIKLGLGGHTTLPQCFDPFKFTGRNRQSTAGFGQVRPGHRKIGPRLRHCLHVLVVIQFRHHLAAFDRIGDIHREPHHPSADLGGNHEIGAGFERAAEGTVQFNGAVFDRHDLHRDRLECPLPAAGLVGVLQRRAEQPEQGGEATTRYGQEKNPFSAG